VPGLRCMGTVNAGIETWITFCTRPGATGRMPNIVV